MMAITSRPLVGVLATAAFAALACGRSNLAENELEPVSARALALLEPASDGRALFPGEVPSTALEAGPALTSREARERLLALENAAGAGDPLSQVRLHLVRHDFDRALSALEGALDAGKAIDHAATERGAILLARYRSGGRSLDLAAALDQFDSAVDEAGRYDRWIALCQLGMTRSARVASSTLSLVSRPRIDSECWNSATPVRRTESPDEDVEAMRALEAHDSQPLREAIEHRWIPELLENENEATLRRARDAASSLARATDDDLAMKLLDELMGENRERKLRTRAAAATWLGAEGQFSALHPEEALSLARSALSSLPADARAWRSRATLTEIASLFHLRRFDEAIQACQRLRQFIDSRSWSDLEGRSYWLEGLSQLQSGKSLLSVGLFSQGKSAFTRAREPGLAANQRVLESDARGDLGDREIALAERLGAIRDLRHHGLWEREAVALDGTAILLINAGLPRAALAVMDEASEASREDHEPFGVAERELWRSRALDASGRPAEALAAADNAIRLAGRVESTALRARLSNRAAAIRGAILVRQNPTEAILGLNKALDVESLEEPYFAPEMLLSRARAKRALFRRVEALSDLERAYAYASDNLATLSGGFERAIFLETRRSIVDELVDLSLESKGRELAALEWAIRGRAEVAARSRTALPRERCPEDGSETLVIYSLPARLVHWTCARGRIEVRSAAIRRDDLLRRIVAFEREVKGGESARAATESEWLFESLLAPVAGQLREGRQIAVIADGLIARVPFAALRDAETTRFVADLGQIVEVDDLQTRRVDTSFWKGVTSRLLVVADPSLDESLAPRFPAMPAAAGEAEMIVSRFPGAEVLAGTRANRAGVLESLVGATGLHVIAHGVAYGEDPGRAAILLSGVSDGVWSSGEISRLQLANLRMVVLSSCESGAGFGTSALGALSVARGFLSAGVGAVVATRWEIDDSMGARFMARFYDALLEVGDPATALKSAQEASIRSADPRERDPAVWGAYFVATGNRAGERRGES